MKNILLDWSGVVRETVQRQLWLVNKIFDAYGIRPISLEEFREEWEQPYIRFYDKYLPPGFMEDERRGIYKEASHLDECPRSSVIPGMQDLIRRWKQDGRFLAVVSSDFTESLHAEIAEWGLENCFVEIASDIDDKLETVERIVVEHALQQEDTFFVGDSNHEIDVAKAAGIRSVATTWGFTSERKLRERKPDHVVRTVRELEDALSA